MRRKSKFSPEFVQKALLYEKEHGTLKTSQDLQVSSATLRDWRADPALRPDGVPEHYPRSRGHSVPMHPTEPTTVSRPGAPRGSKHFSHSYIADALALKDKIGLNAAASQLGISYNTLRNWGTKLNSGKLTLSSKNVPHLPPASSSEVEEALRLVEEIGLDAASRETGRPVHTLRNWRNNMRHHGHHAWPKRRASQVKPRASHVKPSKPMRAARRAPLHIESITPVTEDQPIESAFERGFRLGFKAAIDLIGTEEEGATDE